MRILLDTHVFLWFVLADSRMPAKYVAAIRDPSNEVFLSIISVWEAVIKHQLGKLPMPSPPSKFIPDQQSLHSISSLTIDHGTMQALEGLPPLHRDPFDRILVAQAIQHSLVIASTDANVRGYAVSILAD